MYNTTYEKWLELHNNLNYMKKLPDILFDSWKKSYKSEIDPYNSKPTICSDEKFEQIKEKTKSLYYYTNDTITTNYDKYFKDSKFGLALFDNSGCLLRLYGNKDFHKWAKQNNLEIKTIWDEDTIGTNAVSLGLNLEESISVIGEEHFSKFATNIAMYFSPIIVERNTNTNDVVQYGGIAIITTIENKNSSFLFAVDSIAKGIALHYYWFESIDLFVNSVDGYLIVNQINNKNKIIFISKQVFNFLEIPFRDVYFKDLDIIIDPYPKNKEFWNIVNNKIKVEDKNVELSISGKKININLSSNPFYGKGYYLEGISIIINSKERIHNLISKNTGNNAAYTFPKIIGKSENFINVLKQAEAASTSDVNILLLGESGVGKDLVAQSIHNASERKDKPFVVVNCAALPKELVASELFGYEEGAFTGCKKNGHMGKFELANKGTIFLDEIGDMPLDLQAILLRVIENKSFTKLGGNIPINTDVRIIAATNKNLKEQIQKNKFREDLYYRLGVVKIVIPPLRDRKEDILLLAETFMENICNRINRPLVTLSDEVKEFFLTYHWPGNVRELQNLLEGVLQIYDDPVINYEHIANYIIEEPISKPNKKSKKNSSLNHEQINTKQHMSSLPDPKEYITNALKINKHNKTKAAKYLGISRSTLYAKLKKYNIPY